MYKRQEVAKSFTAPGDWLNADIPVYEYNPEKAKELLKEAGWPSDYTPVSYTHLETEETENEAVETDEVIEDTKPEIVEKSEPETQSPDVSEEGKDVYKRQETEIVELVTKAAAQLNNQEMRVRSATLNTSAWSGRMRHISPTVS